MTDQILLIPPANLSIVFIPVFIVLIILYLWRLEPGNAIYALARMIIQLLLVGYFLAYLFGSENAWVVVLVLSIMILVSSWIALRTVTLYRQKLYKAALFSILLGGGITLLLITQGVLNLEPWYRPSYMIPIAGMVFANSMTSISLAAERLQAEITRHVPYEKARNIAFQAAMIPIINSLFAVGLVSLPGMMTGQILSGISPLIAVRYQIMVMCMIFGSAGISTAYFLYLVKPKLMHKENH